MQNQVSRVDACAVHVSGYSSRVPILAPEGQSVCDTAGRKRSMHIALEDLGLQHLWIIYPGDQKYVLDDKITVMPLEKIIQLAETELTN